MGPVEYIVRKPAIAATEIVILFVFFYAILRIMGGTRVSGIVRALVVGFILLYAGVQYLAKELHLDRVEGLLGAIVGGLGITGIVVFAPDVRRLLARLAESPFLFPLMRPVEAKVVDEIAEAADRMARKKTGALIVVERDIGLAGFTNAATRVDAEVSSLLLESLFYAGSPLHDGAAVVCEGRVVAAGVVLPLSENPDLAPQLGTRHRAGLGITEESDAIAVIVSEEQGTVSVAARGKLIRDQEKEPLRRLLRELLARREQGEAPLARSIARVARIVTRRKPAETEPPSAAPAPPRDGGNPESQ